MPETVDFEIRPPRAWERWFYVVARGLLVGWARVWFRLRVDGADKVPATGPFVLSPVHRSNLDFLLAAAVTRRRMRYMGKDSIWKWKPGGAIVSALGAFPVHRGTADREALRTSLQVLDLGEPLVVFLEGTRRSGPIVSEVFDGPAYLACRGRVPVVPVGIGGSEAAMPRGAKWVRPRKVVVVVGDPIHPPPLDEGARVPRRVVRELTEQVRGEVQRLFDTAQVHAGTPNVPGLPN